MRTPARWARHGWPLLSALLAGPALAHGLDANLLTVQLAGPLVRLEVTPTVDALSFVDDDGSGHLTKAELDAHREALRALYAKRVLLSNEAGAVPALTFFDVIIPGGAQNAPDGRDHISFRAQHTFEAPAEGLVVDYALFPPSGTPLVQATAGKKAPLLAEMGQVERATLTPVHTRAVFFLDGEQCALRAELLAAPVFGAPTSTEEPPSLRKGLGLLLLATALVLAGLVLVRRGKRQQQAERDAAASG